MRDWEFAAFALALPFLPCACGGESRPYSSYTAHTFHDQACEHLPPEGF